MESIASWLSTLKEMVSNNLLFFSEILKYFFDLKLILLRVIRATGWVSILRVSYSLEQRNVGSSVKALRGGMLSPPKRSSKLAHSYAALRMTSKGNRIGEIIVTPHRNASVQGNSVNCVSFG